MNGSGLDDKVMVPLQQGPTEMIPGLRFQGLKSSLKGAGAVYQCCTSPMQTPKICNGFGNLKLSNGFGPK